MCGCGFPAPLTLWRYTNLFIRPIITISRHCLRERYQLACAGQCRSGWKVRRIDASTPSVLDVGTEYTDLKHETIETWTWTAGNSEWEALYMHRSGVVLFPGHQRLIHQFSPYPKFCYWYITWTQSSLPSSWTFFRTKIRQIPSGSAAFPVTLARLSLQSLGATPPRNCRLESSLFICYVIPQRQLAQWLE